MNAVLRPTPVLEPMAVRDLDAVHAVEQQVYPFPWTRGNFVDSLAANHVSRVLHATGLGLLGYFVAMEGVEEMHLLNITVVPGARGQGHAVRMLDALVAACRERGARQLWLEVRETNAHAKRIYERYGFRTISARKAYYPAARETHPSGREDAWVMVLDLATPERVESGHAVD